MRTTRVVGGASPCGQPVVGASQRSGAIWTRSASVGRTKTASIRQPCMQRGVADEGAQRGPRTDKPQGSRRRPVGHSARGRVSRTPEYDGNGTPTVESPGTSPSPSQYQPTSSGRY